MSENYEEVNKRINERNKIKEAFKILVAGAVGGLAVGGLAAVFSADTVPEGHVGLKTHAFSGRYDDTLLSQGYSINPLSKVKNLKKVQIPIEIKDLRPKDKDGILSPIPHIQVSFLQEISHWILRTCPQVFALAK